MFKHSSLPRPQYLTTDTWHVTTRHKVCSLYSRSKPCNNRIGGTQIKADLQKIFTVNSGYLAEPVCSQHSSSSSDCFVAHSTQWWPVSQWASSSLNNIQTSLASLHFFCQNLWKSNKICISRISTETTPSMWREEDVESDQAIMNDNDTLQPHVTLNTPLPC